MPRRVLHDEFFKKAKAEGYVARSAYKLQQIQESKRLIRKGDYVLDLGCAPGAWLQVASDIVGPTGRVVGIDLQPIRHQMPANVKHLVSDIYKTSPADLTALVEGRFDVILSDMAPNTNGINDHELSIRLCDQTVSLLPALIKPGGSFAIKVFEGADYPRFQKDVSALFENCRGFKPKASREVSREMYIVAAGYRGAILTGTP
jgi:23S rRNA (uridine2552-2'-O)-methyltransferase